MIGTSLTVQWSGLRASAVRACLQPLLWKLRACILQGTIQNKGERKEQANLLIF